MDETGFHEFMKKLRKSETTIKTSIEAVKQLESYLDIHAFFHPILSIE